MSWLVIAIVALFGLLLSAFFSGAETGLYCVNRLRLHLGVQRGDVAALRLASVIDNEQNALCVTLVGTNLSNYITTAAAVYALDALVGLSRANAEIYTVVLLTPIVFVFGEVVPKNLFRLHPDTLLARGSHPLVFFSLLFRMTGIVPALRWLISSVYRFVGGSDATAASFIPKRRVAGLLQEALAADAFGQDQSELIDRVCRLSETRLHRVMIPRNRVIAINARADRRELTRVVRRTGHARLPVFESDRRRIVGVIKVDEMLQSTRWQVVGDRLRPVVSFSAHDTVATAMTRLQRAGRGMAIVTDHGGRMLGIVTLKDLIGEVVGGIPSSV